MPSISRFHRFFMKAVAVAVAAALLMTPAVSQALAMDEEREMGREVLAAVKKNMTVVDDPTITSYVSDVGHRILAAIGPQPFEYHFYVIDSEVINAFAVPAGYIFINSEVISSMQNEGQLAAIVAHEIAHVTTRHIARRLEKNRTFNLAVMAGMLAGALIGGPAGSAVMMGSMGGSIQAQLANSRSDEAEADRKGLDYLVKAGYDPRCMAESFEIMIRNSYHAPAGIPTYLTTHPGLTDRIASVQNAVSSHPAYKKILFKGDQNSFMAVKDRVIAFLTDPSRARNYFEDRLKKDPNDAYGYYGLGLILQNEQQYPQAVDKLKQALKIQPANPVFLTDLGDLLIRSKDFSEAMTVLGRAVILKPDSSRALYLLGQTYEARGESPRALGLYEKVLDLDPNYIQAYCRTGILYGQQGDLARAHLNTGLCFKGEGQFDQALYHFEQAQKNYASAPLPVRDRIDQQLVQLKSEKKKNSSGAKQP